MVLLLIIWIHIIFPHFQSSKGTGLSNRITTCCSLMSAPPPLSYGWVELAVRTQSAFLKVPKCEIFDRSEYPDFYTIKSSWVGDLVVKILTYYFNF